MGLLLTLAEDTNLFGRQIQKQMRDYFGDLVFKTAIHRTVRLAEAPSAGQSVMTYCTEISRSLRICVSGAGSALQYTEEVRT